MRAVWSGETGETKTARRRRRKKATASAAVWTVAAALGFGGWSGSAADVRLEAQESAARAEVGVDWSAFDEELTFEEDAENREESAENNGNSGDDGASEFNGGSGNSENAESAAASTGLEVVAKTENGVLARLDGVRNVLILSGTPAEMGAAHGRLLGDDVREMNARIAAVGVAASLKTGENFAERIEEATQRTAPFVPKRFFEEMDALAAATGLEPSQVRRINTFPELFHCSGVALRGSATVGGRVLHARVLDYMRDVGLQNNAALIVYRPEGRNAWLSVSYAGFVGTVTAMNDKGLAIGEMGGAGEGKWDGLPMAYLMRRVVEECATVDEALALMRSTPLTCDYYYVLSDAAGNMAAVEAIAERDPVLRVMRPGECDPRLPGALDDCVYISGPGERADTLFKRLNENFGKIDVPTLIEILERPVSMKSNLHDAIFAPETLDVWFAEAGATTPACDEKYYRANLREALEFYDRENVVGAEK
ncbi:MAG: hypothetical protein IJN32_02550 [Thermoguttaceae bacterium]|nr:hypothetical protein [Thermoguttaceae bacterium]